MTTYQVTATAGSQELAQLVDAAVRGDEVAIVRDGHVVAKIVSVAPASNTESTPRRKRVLGRLAGRIKMSPDFDASQEELRTYMDDSGHECHRQCERLYGV